MSEDFCMIVALGSRYKLNFSIASNVNIITSEYKENMFQFFSTILKFREKNVYLHLVFLSCEELQAQRTGRFCVSSLLDFYFNMCYYGHVKSMNFTHYFSRKLCFRTVEGCARIFNICHWMTKLWALEFIFYGFSQRRKGREDALT